MVVAARFVDEEGLPLMLPLLPAQPGPLISEFISDVWGIEVTGCSVPWAMGDVPTARRGSS